jgi:hypothetical protein
MRFKTACDGVSGKPHRETTFRVALLKAFRIHCDVNGKLIICAHCFITPLKSASVRRIELRMILDWRDQTIILFSDLDQRPKMWTKLKAKSDRRILGWFPKRHSTIHVVSFSLPEV